MADQPVASTSSTSNAHAFKNTSLDDVFEDLSSRFILNLPEEELVSVERICFQVEQAHWYYEDFIREEEPSFPSMALKTFSRHLFHACPLLQHWSKDHDQAFQTFLDYKTAVPCVLVKGWKANSSWSFPRGKINAEEPEHECATREALEETGYDVSDNIVVDAAIRITMKGQDMTFFVVPNVPEDTVFIPRTRKEISKVDWFPLHDLPMWKKGVPKEQSAFKAYGIAPLIAPLKGVLKTLKKAEWERNNAQRSAPIPDTSASLHTPATAALGAASPHQLVDPAIFSIPSSAPTENLDHLSRLLGALATTNPGTVSVSQSTTHVVSTKSTVLDGSLPTPQATPSTSSAKRNELPAHLAHPAPLQQQPSGPVPIYASPTPPHSGDPMKQSAFQPPPPPEAPKSKFEFISPFDALASPPKKRISAQPAKPADIPPPISTRLSEPSVPPTASASAPNGFANGTQATSPPAQVNHFAPASVVRARYARSRGASTSSASIASMTSPSSSSLSAQSVDNSPQPNGAFPSAAPSKQAKHAALLQSLASDLMSKSTSSTPAPSFAAFPPATPSNVAPHLSMMQSPPHVQAQVPYPYPPPPQHEFQHPQHHMNGIGHGSMFGPYPPPPMMNGPQPPHYAPLPHYPVSGPSVSHPPQPIMLTNGHALVHGPGAGAGVSTSRSATPRTAPAPHFARPGGGAGPGSPIKIVPPAQPLERGQLLALLNGPSAPPTQPPANGIGMVAPAALYGGMQPPQIARKASQPQPQLQAGGIARMMHPPAMGYAADANHGGPGVGPSSYTAHPPRPAASASQPNLGLLSILNVPRQ